MGMIYAFFLNKVSPEKKILVLEKLSGPALESSFPFNNAGTWHGANCELNYTPQNKNGEVEIEKAIDLHQDAVKILEFISYLIENNILDKPERVINRTSNSSLVFGEKDGDFLKKRIEKMKQHHFFENMKMSQDFDEIQKWTSELIIKGRAKDEKLTASLIENGACLNFGAITKTVFNFLEKKDNIDFKFNSEVVKLKRQKEEVQIETNSGQNFSAKKLFIACGGNSLILLQKLKLREAENYAGFPVGGEFLICKNEDITHKLRAKVYGKASVGAPPMSVPHFDTRFIDGKRYILFGPRATFNPKFLKTGSYFDLLKSVKLNNIFPMMSVAKDDFSLVKYLIKETLSGKKKLFKELKEFYPEAKEEDWDINRAGQRVQIIKKDSTFTGELKLGTEVLVSDDGNIGALLGASPGATMTPKVMIDMIKMMHKEQYEKENWVDKIKEIIKSHTQDLKNNKDLYFQIRNKVDKNLNLK